MKKNIIIAAAIVCAFSATAANAATVTFTGTPLLFSTQEVTKTPLTGAATTVATVPAITATAGVKVGDTVRVTLTGGAIFNRATVAGTANFITATGNTTAVNPIAFAADSTAIINTAATSYSIKLSATDLDATAAGNQLASKTNGAVVFTIASNTTGILDLTGAVAGVPVGMKVEVLSTPALSAPNTPQTVNHTGTTNATSALVTVSNGYVAFATAPTSTVKIIDVTKVFKGFTTATQTAVTSSLSASSASAVAATGGYNLYTISGPMAGVTSITETNAVLVQDSGLQGAAIAAPATPTAAGDFFIDTAANKAYASSAPGAVNPGALTFAIDGTTALSSGAYTVQVDYVKGTNAVLNSHVAIAATELSKWTRDGTSFVVNRMAPQSTIRMSNLSKGTASGNITIIAKNAANVTVPNSGLAVNAMPTAVASGNTVTISGADIQAAFPAAATYEFAIESNDVLASHRQATAAGLTTTVYRSSTTAGGL